MKQLNNTFGKINRSGKINKFLPIKSHSKSSISHTLNNKAVSSNLYIIFRLNMMNNDINKYVIYTIGNILTNGLDSRLYKKLRAEKGLVYSVQYDVDLSEVSNTLSSFSINTQVLDSKLVEVISIILDELKKISKELVTTEEMIKEQSDNKMYYLSKNLDKNPISELDRYSKYLLWGHKPITIKQEFNFLKKISKKDVLTYAQKIFDFSKINIFYSGKKNHNQEINKLLILKN